MKNIASQMREMAYLSLYPFDLINYKNILRLIKEEARIGNYTVQIDYSCFERHHKNDLTHYADKLRLEGFEVDYASNTLFIKW